MSRTGSVQAWERILVRAFCGEMVAFAETTDDLSGSCAYKAGLHCLLSGWLWLRLLEAAQRRLSSQYEMIEITYLVPCTQFQHHGFSDSRRRPIGAGFVSFLLTKLRPCLSLCYTVVY